MRLFAVAWESMNTKRQTLKRITAQTASRSTGLSSVSSHEVKINSNKKNAVLVKKRRNVHRHDYSETDDRGIKVNSFI